MNFIPIIFIAVIPTFVLADDLYTNDIVGGCGDAYYFNAEFEPISYTCSSGTYLPAGAISCQACPNTHTCNGGTFSFDANHTQGLSYGDVLVTDAIGSCSSAFTQNYSAVFEPITYVCPAGYYLPAGEDWVNDTEGCRTCLNDNYCAGGTYTFNETTAQGITPCPSVHPFAPAGMWQQSQCGRKLHIADDVLYMPQQQANPTVHQLHISYNDVTYSANAVLRDMTPGADFPKVSAGATKGLHIKIHETINGIEDDYEYLICDDSVCPNQ